LWSVQQTHARLHDGSAAAHQYQTSIGSSDYRSNLSNTLTSQEKHLTIKQQNLDQTPGKFQRQFIPLQIDFVSKLGCTVLGRVSAHALQLLVTEV